MSEEILNAILELFAILCRQEKRMSPYKLKNIRNFLKQKVSRSEVDNYYNVFIDHLNKSGPANKGMRPLESLEILTICYRINGTLKQDQKIIVIMQCLQLFEEDESSIDIHEVIATCCDVFNISADLLESMTSFVRASSPSNLPQPNILVIGEFQPVEGVKFIRHHLNASAIALLKIDQIELFFVKLFGKGAVLLNGKEMSEKAVQVFPSGGVISLPSGETFYYTDLLHEFQPISSFPNLSFTAKNISVVFNNELVGLHPISVEEEAGKLVGIMGGSGSGKTTLLNALAGLTTPSKGKVLLNGLDIQSEESKKQIGFIAQDDLLINELTVFQNLFYNTRLILGELSEAEITEKVDHTLKLLGLLNVKNHKVGSIHDKVLSGGQRKRLNIGFELIRNPSLLFIDEPTSGLSSKDSENIMMLLSELRNTGHLIFVIIHQPSSVIYKLFDKVILLDQGGYCIYQGNPINALQYFKDYGDKINKHQTHCALCGNVDSQEIFNIVEERIVNEYGIETEDRKNSPESWYNIYLQNERFDQKQIDTASDSKNTGKDRSIIPGKWKQFTAYLQRDFNTKITDFQYLILVILEPLLLSLLLSLAIKRSSEIDQPYTLMKNDNLPAYFFISIIVMVFLGISLSAEEIFKDRKILKREHFLGLSRFSYLSSKIFLMFSISLLQSIIFIAIGNSILEIKDNLLTHCLLLFTIACNSNLIGLVISSSFKSAVTIYILIPLLVIPQIVLGGAIFDYESLNKKLEDPGFAPNFVAIIPARWAYEGILVEKFRNNDYQKLFNSYDSDISKFSFKNGEFSSKLYELSDLGLNQSKAAQKGEIPKALRILKNEINREIKDLSFLEMDSVEEKDILNYDEQNAMELKNKIERIANYYKEQFNMMIMTKDIYISDLQNQNSPAKNLTLLRKNHQNQQVERIVRKSYSKQNLIIKNNRIRRLYEPIFIEHPPEFKGQIIPKFPHFSAFKTLFGFKLPTYWYNLIILWFLSIILYFTLYFNLLKKLLRFSVQFKLN